MMSKYIIVAVAMALSAWGGSEWTDRGWSQRWAERDALDATARAQAVTDAIATRNARIKQLETVTDETKAELAKAELARRNADAAANSLQQHIEDILRRARNTDRATTIERAAAGTDIVVLADVLRRADRRAGDLAEIAGARYVAGLNCQRRYEIMSGG